MASKAFSNTLSNLASDKLKDRTQGLEDVRLFLSLQRNIDWMNEDRRQWLKFLQSIFQIVVDEQRTYISKPTTPALKRLKDAAQAVRMIIEKAAADIPRKAFKAVFNHILSIIVVRGKLFEPVALEYLKALKASIAYQPHLDHLDLKQWSHGVSTCFSAILEDNIRGYEIIDDSVLDMDDDTADEASMNGSRKRKAALQSHDLADIGGSSQGTGHTSAGQDTIELCGCIDAFFRSMSAPLISNGEALLSKFVRFFEIYPKETTAHLSMTIALNRLLGELELNRKKLLEKAVHRLWPPVIRLWLTKSVAMKEQLVMSATLLLPYTRALQPERRISLASDLYIATLADAELRWGVETLDLDLLTLRCSETALQSVPSHGFALSIFQAGPTFDFQQSLAWTVLTLSASCLMQAQDPSQTTNVEPPTPTRSSKRRKPEPPKNLYKAHLDDLTSESNKIVIHRLQVLLFWLELDATGMSSTRIRQLQDAVTPLLSHELPDVQNWALLLLANLARVSTQNAASKKTGETSAPIFWAQIWERTLKLLQQAHVSRTACFLLWTLYSTHSISRNKAVSDLVSVASDIEVQGPSSPSDAASAFLQVLLQVAGSDFRSYNSDVPGKICSRVIGHWHWPSRNSRSSRSFAQKSNVEPVNAVSLLELFSALSSRKVSPKLLPTIDVVVPDAALTSFWRTRRSLTPLRDWFWDATMPEMQSSPGELLPTADAGLVGAPQTDIVAVRLVVHLRSLVEQLFQDSEDRDDVYWTGITLDRLRSMLDLVWLSLAFDAHLDANQIIRNERVAAQALQLLQVIMPRVQQNKWTESERATLLTAIAPLCIDVPRTTGSYEMLVSAGPFSGIRHSMLPDDNSERRSLLRPVLYLRPVLSAVNSENTMESPLLKQIWETPGVLDTFSDQAALFWQILKLDSAATHQTADDADFGPIRVTASTQMTGRATLDAGTSLATSTCLSVALRALLTPSYFKEADRKPVRMRSLVKQLLEDTGVRFILVGEHLLEALQSGYLSLSSNELEGIVDKIGTELLPSYEYSRTEDLQLFVVKFLQATASQWGREEAMEMPYVDKARRLSAWFAGQLLVDNSLSWKVRNACIDLLDHFITSRRVDPLLFGHDTELSACKDGVPVSPDVILIGMLDDADYRVRVKLAPVLGRLCSYIHRVGRQSFSIWTKIAEGAKFDYQGSHLESNITTLLTYSNIMVASDFFRSNAYHPVIVLAALDASASLSMYVKAALTATANRLGLQDTATLYTFLAPFTLAEHLYNSQEGLLIPDPSVFGFPNKQALYSARFEETAPMILAGPRPNFFQELCAYAGTNPETALVKVFPTYIAYKLTAGEPGSGDYKLAEQDIAFKAVQVAAENGLQAPEMLRNMRDLVVWRLFSFVWEAEYSFESLQATISKCWPATPSLQTFLRDVLGGADPPFRPNVLSPPDVRLEAILYSIKRSHPAVAGALDDIAILNSVLHRLLSAVAEPPFTSQQLRLLHNAALCMACSANTLSKSTHLLTMLMHRLATLAQQDDLLPLSSKLFMWVLGQLGALRHAQKSGLQDETHSILLAADAALIYSQREDDVSGRADNVAKRPALEFLRNLEGWIKSLRRYDDPRMNESLNRLSVLWPRPLPPSCNQTLNLEQVQDIVDFAGNTPSVYNALGIFRRSLLQQDSSKDACRISNILWRIFASTNSKLARGSLRPETVRAFADLVFASGGQVCPPGLNGSIQTKRRTVIGDTDARTVMLSSLCDLLNDSNLATAHLAFETLLKIASLSTGDLPPVDNVYFDMIRAPQIKRLLNSESAMNSPIDLAGLLRTDYLAEIANDREKWLQAFASLISKVLGQRWKFFQPCSELLATNRHLARRCLPALIQALLLDTEGPATRQILSTYFEALIDRRSPCAVDVMELVLALRASSPPQDFAGLDNSTSYDLWLSVPYSKLGQIAMEAQEYSAALLCIELSREYSHIESGKQSQEKELLYEVYSHLQEPDGFYSISAFDLPHGLVRRLQHEGRWLEALSWHGAGLEAAPHKQEGVSEIQKILACLAHGDLSHLSMKLFQANPQATGLSEILPSLAWKTQSWDIPVPQDPEMQAQYRIYDALKSTAGSGGNITQEDSLLHLSKEVIALTSIEKSTPAVDKRRLHNILALREVLQWRENVPLCLNDYAAETVRSLHSFEYEAAETILQTRIVLLSSFRASEARKSLGDEPSKHEVLARKAERATLLNLSAIARQENRKQVALNAVLKCQGMSEAVDHELAMAVSSVLWLQNESIAAIETLRQFLSKNVDVIAEEDQAQLLAQMGTWIATARLEDASTIRESYFEQAWHLIHRQDAGVAAGIALQYARFADQQYQEMSQQVAEIDQLDSYTRKKEIEVLQLVKQSKSSQGTSSEINSRHRVASAISQQDRQTIDQFRSSRKALLESAVLMYSHALSGEDVSSDAIFRLCSLWLGNADDETFCANARKPILNISSYHFISLMPQLSARLAVMPAQGASQFQRTLAKLVERIAIDHPFHSLFQLYFLFNTAAGQASQSGSQRRRSLGPDSSHTHGPMRDLIIRLRQYNTRMQEITQAIELAIEAYADWASMRVEKQKSGSEKVRPVPSGLKLLRLKNLPLPITTLALAVDKSGVYSPERMPCIVAYRTTYTTAGGVNLPKITDCLGTDGVVYRQLFKGGDDVRQDAVMQQVFGVTNEMLDGDERTHARKLGVRTYKVIPLTSDCGLLEFVSNSQAIGDWLIPAHAKYRPNDMPILEARKMLGEKQKSSDKDRIEVYKKILKRVHPVMRHFFTEKHHVPYWWFQMRLNYSRSAAAMSMVGYVMGLGDRHVSNIMIDTVNGELVPIDFGIAFEAGKQLPTPELVPFRLTPDIVDGFGISGVEGVFRKCSEETIRVLRSKAAVLMTILEVFKYDPLQKWTASASKVRRVQGSQALERSDENGRTAELTDADRAIRTVSEKLKSDLSVEYNVNDLILQARDVARLGTIFFGWQPYL